MQPNVAQIPLNSPLSCSIHGACRNRNKENYNWE